MLAPGDDEEELSSLIVGRQQGASTYRSIQDDGVGNNGDEHPPEYPGLIHVVPDVDSRSRWNHIDDLDSFFRRLYWYHQKHGIWCMVLQEALELAQFAFVIVFSVFLFECVDYDVLFKNKPAPGHNTTDKISISDALLPAGQCMTDLNGFLVIALVLASAFWLLFFVRFVFNFFLYWEIARFYTNALKISLNDLDNLTWHEVQRRLRDVQKDLHLCVHKPVLTELDVYNRILRFENYFIAMVNKRLLPLHFPIPSLGELVFLSRGLKYNLELILFRAPWAPFENNWHLRPEYKVQSRRGELAERLAKRIAWFAAANLVLSPLIFLWQILYSIFHYTELLKKDPSFLGMRKWSAYGRVYLRHFNELDHELNARLNRGYEPATKYMSSFTSPLLTVIAKKVVFFCGAPLAVLIILTVIDEDVLTAEHVLTAMTIMGGIVAACRALIPDENMVWCPELLMNTILAQVHYLPDNWSGKAHTNAVREQFAQLFQLKFVYVLEELLSPIVTPFVLFFMIRPQATGIVDFLRNFTVDVVGVGDVCSFAQMDVKRHGSPTWTVDEDEGVQTEDGSQVEDKKDLLIHAENGKTELSLVHFALTNPDWQPPRGAGTYLQSLQRHAQREFVSAQNHDFGGAEMSIYAQSLNAVSQMPFGNALGGLPPGVGGMWPGSCFRTLGPSSFFKPRSGPLRGGISRIEGSIHKPSEAGLLRSVTEGFEDSLMGMSTGVPTFGQVRSDAGDSQHGSGGGDHANMEASFGARSVHGGGSGMPAGPLIDRIVEFNAANMSFSAIYLHEMHRRRILNRRGSSRPAPRSQSPLFQVIPEDDAESSTNAAVADPNSGSVYYQLDDKFD